MISSFLSSLLMVFPVRWAADYAGANKATYGNCMFCVSLVGALKTLIETLMPGFFLIVFLLLLVAAALVCAVILKVPNANISIFMVNYILLYMVFGFVVSMFIKEVFG